MPAAAPFWETLFVPPSTGGTTTRISLRLLKRHGQPFLLLPHCGQAACRTLDLYPAQTPKARVAKTLLRLSSSLPVPGVGSPVTIEVASDDPFALFLRDLAKAPPGTPLRFGILAGNPASPGQRFLLLLFDERDRPVAVVKIGTSPRAIELVRSEQAFLTQAEGRIGIPKLRAALKLDRLEAFALDFFAGASPSTQDLSALESLLNGWLHTDQEQSVSECPEWKALNQAASGHPLFAALTQSVGRASLHPAIHHGDLAPWNIKASPAGQWTVLDWERGVRKGMPAWDWFHYVLQPAILVERCSAPALVARAAALLNEPAFAAYSRNAGVDQARIELLLGYLLYMTEVIQPSEGFDATRSLLDALRSHWRPRPRNS